MAKPLPEIENPMLRDPIPYRSPEPVYAMYKPDPLCACGCGERIAVVEYRTHEGEPLSSQDCILKFVFAEKWIERMAV